MDLKSLIRTIPDYPKPGIMFRDITTLLADPVGFRHTIDELVAHGRRRHVDKVACIESRGLIIGAPVAYQLGKGMVPLRKKGKLPWKTVGREYDLEYGTDRIEMHLDAIAPGEAVLLIDDLLATGGTAEAGAHLIEQHGGKVVECCFVIELPELGGRKRLEAHGYPVFALVAFEGH